MLDFSRVSKVPLSINPRISSIFPGREFLVADAHNFLVICMLFQICLGRIRFKKLTETVFLDCNDDISFNSTTHSFTHDDRSILRHWSRCTTTVSLSMLMNLKGPSHYLRTVWYSSTGLPDVKFFNIAYCSFPFGPPLCLRSSATFLRTCLFATWFINSWTSLGFSSCNGVGKDLAGLGIAPKTRNAGQATPNHTVQLTEKTASSKHSWSLASRPVAEEILSYAKRSGASYLSTVSIAPDVLIGASSKQIPNDSRAFSFILY